jgi:hypothetical protein
MDNTNQKKSNIEKEKEEGKKMGSIETGRRNEDRNKFPHVQATITQ